MTKPTPAADKNTSSRYHMAPTVFSLPDKICNASSTQPLKLSDYRKTPARIGSEDFLRCRSKGV